MNPKSPLMCGAEEYRHLIDAIRYYEKAGGYKYVDAPWAVSKEAMDITRPAWAGPVTMSYLAGGVELCPVASAEQSFLQMQMDADKTIRGKYVAMTPCFRNEPTVDALHQPYFMKVELIQWVEPDQYFRVRADLDNMLGLASDFFENHIDIDIVTNTDPDPIGLYESARDIVSLRTRVELGSYGIRSHPAVGMWIYGTGCAEPRFTHVIGLEGRS
jgi:hypothetical protein